MDYNNEDIYILATAMAEHRLLGFNQAKLDSADIAMQSVDTVKRFIMEGFCYGFRMAQSLTEHKDPKLSELSQFLFDKDLEFATGEEAKERIEQLKIKVKNERVF